MALPHHLTMVANLKRLYRRSTAEDKRSGLDWYPSARRIVREWSAHYGYHPSAGACVIAAISPQCPWERNLVIADDVLAQRPPSIGAIRENVRKALILRDVDPDVWNYLSAEDMMPRVFPTGPKVACFAGNLGGSSALVTVDTHAAQAAVGDPTFSAGLRWKLYTAIATAYAEAAADFDIAPADFQAILWVTWKRVYPSARKRTIKAQYVS